MSGSETFGAVIVAAGGGSRMRGLDKLFTDVTGKPLLAYAIAPFQECAAFERVVLVVSAHNVERGQRLVRDHAPSKVAAVVPGGERRQDSVRLGVEALGECDYVAVHDGARPMVEARLIARGMEAVRETGAAVPAVPLADTVKEVGRDALVVRTVDRTRLWAVQTPQFFRYDLLLRAHSEHPEAVTDDAALLEAMGLPVKIFPGDKRNLKVTTPEDLELVRALVGSRILHLLSREDWEQARHVGEYRAASLDGEGFIHCCTDAQLSYVLRTYFAGIENLVLLRIDPAKAASEIKWEDSGPGGPFPHIYGPLNLDAVVSVEEVPSP